jgi:hypothetical protein
LDIPGSSGFSIEDMGKAFLRFPAKIAIGMFGSMSMLMAEHPVWQKFAPKIHKDILKKQPKLIVMLRDVATQIDTTSGRGWFCIYAGPVVYG